LPEVLAFAQLLGRLGIGPDSHVVVYDNKSAANAAARFWWMLAAVGHSGVQVLDGGLSAAVAAGLPVSAEVETPPVTAFYPASAWVLPTATADDVARATQSGRHPVIDVREAVRYRGETEPIDVIAGHIPGAINIPFSSNLAADGKFLAPEVLRQKYQDVIDASDPAEAIVHCGSGVTACHTLLAMPRLYVGSWSEWSRSGRPVATGTV
jgi:thiosulfate/3-mercaptopyruvate sulfurtransferase